MSTERKIKTKERVMLARKCDRCNEYYDDFKYKYVVIKNDGISVRDIDLCPECNKKLKDWLEENNRTEGTTL